MSTPRVGPRTLCDAALLALLTAASPSMRAQSHPASASTEQRIVGTVLDALGEPLPLADVWAIAPWPLPREDEGRLATARTDGSGMFVLRLPRRELQSVVVCATAEGRTLESASWRLEAQPAQTALRLRVWDAGKVQGRVLDRAGAPIAGAAVCARGQSRVAVGHRCNATTDAAGRYTLDHVPLGAIELAAWRDGFVLASRTASVPSESDVDLTLDHGEGIRISLHVSGLPEGRSACAVVDTQGAWPLPLPLRGGDVAPDGTWSRGGYRAAPMHVFLFPDRLSPTEPLSFEPRVHRFAAGKAEHALVSRASAGMPTRVSGALRDPEGRPLAGVIVLCGPAVPAFLAAPRSPEASATTDTQGRFALQTTLPAGVEAALILAGTRLVLTQDRSKGGRDDANPGYETQHVFTIRDGVELALRAEPAAALRGRVVDARGAPVRLRELLLASRDGQQPGAGIGVATTSTDREGAFAFEGLRGTQRELRVTLGWNRAATSEPVFLTPGETITSLVVTAPDLGSVRGVVRDATGKVLPGARVWLRDLDPSTGKASPRVVEVLTDRAGRFHHLEVEPGAYRVELHAAPPGPEDEAGAASGRFEVEPGQRLAIDLVAK